MTISRMWAVLVVVLAVIVFSAVGASAASGSSQAQARDILSATAVKGGLVVHVGCEDGRLTAALRASKSYVVHGLETDRAAVEKARQYIGAQDMYGPVSVSHWDGGRLPYIDNLVNLLVVEEPGNVSEREMMRVLAPRGVACVRDGDRWVKKIKPWPDDIDQWTHYLHGPDNNAVARDTVVEPPRGLQWVSGPMWSRSHGPLNGTGCMVSANGRIFTIEDRAPIELPRMPGKYTLVARDAFNGVVLWKRQLKNWEAVYHWMKATPVQLTRRLIAVGDRVYATLGIHEPVSELDAATGEVLKTYRGTKKTQEIVLSDSVLYLVTGDRMKPHGIDLGKKSHYRPEDAIYGLDSYSPQRKAKKNPENTILAVDASTGEKLWEKSGAATKAYQGTTLAVGCDRLAYQTEEDLVCLEPSNGKVLWKRNVPIQMKGDFKLGGAAPTLVIRPQAILKADNKNLIAFSPENGEELWRTKTRATYFSSPDIFVVSDTVWPYPSLKGYNITTGDVVGRRRVTRDGPMGHDRCYRNKATVRYMINSRSGGADFSEFNADYSVVNPWIRGTCSLGIMPCNGLLYGSPHACSCVNVALRLGFNALNSKTYADNPHHPLVKGPAFDKRLPGEAGAGDADWPTYRHDPGRTGNTGQQLPSDLERLWSVDICDPTPIAVAGKNLYVAEKEGHTLHCLDVSDGSQKWQFTAGGRIDSPPTCHKGRVLFGSADGWVYCLTAEAGKLVWKFRAAPERRLASVFGQIESLWPVHGSVLLVDDTVYFAAGRNTFLNGGMFMFGLDVETGKKKYETRLSGPYTDSGEPILHNVPRKTIKGNKTDILVYDGEYIYLRHMAFRPDLTPADVKKHHLMTVSGFLDDAKHHRSFWTVTEDMYYDTILAPRPDADMLVLDGKRIFGMRGYPSSRRTATQWDPRERGFTLFSMIDRGNTGGKIQYVNHRGKKRTVSVKAIKYVQEWDSGVQVNCTAMLKSGNLLFIAGKPSEFPEDDMYKAVEGRMGGFLVVASAKDGSELKRYRFDSPPRWDGLAAAGGRLYIALQDGQIVCLGSE